MHYPNEFELWRVHRDELAREMDRKRLTRRLRSAGVRRGAHYHRGIEQNERLLTLGEAVPR